MKARFERTGMGRLTWLGLGVAMGGWALLVAAVAAGGMPPAPPAGWPARLVGLRADLLVLAPCLIGSGFALAVIGSLHAGFGALDRFFEAALRRSHARTTAPFDAAPFDAAPLAGAADGEALRGEVIAGRTADGGAAHRPYRTLPDGSVEVETIVGTRRFATMKAARPFI